MKAIVFHGPRDFRYEDVGDPRIEAEGDAILRVTCTAICGSDLHLWNGGLPVAESGFVVGHEFVGVVEEVGGAVQTLRPGDRVFASCTLGCGSCDCCRRGLFSGCAVTTAGGTRTNIAGFSAVFPGGQAELARVPFADVNVFAIPDGVSDEQAVFLTDILPTADLAVELAEVRPGDRVVVFGCGPVGSLAQQCAQIHGAAQVIAVDLSEGRLARARKRGCDAVNPEREDLAGRVLELTGGQGADAVIEAVGRPELVGAAVPLLRPGGRVSVVGIIVAPVELPWAVLLMRNLSVRTGLVNPQGSIAPLLRLVESGRIDPTELITHRLPLSEGVHGYQIFFEQRDEVLKVLLSP
ncbi:zinc-binding dehydrogenase [bacterium]|nr:zinc-binding dehydrogenase [bacterium]